MTAPTLLTRSLAVIAFVAAAATGRAQGPQQVPQPGSAPAREKAPDAVDILRRNQIVRRVSIAEIQEAATTQIVRYGQTFSATPFDVVLRLAALPEGTRVRVVGEEDDMVLQAGSNDEDPARYVIIFNMRGFPVLTPIPEAPAGSDPVSQGGRGRTWALPPPGSGGGNPSSAGNPPPPGSGAAGRGGNQNPVPATPGALPTPGSGRGVGSASGARAGSGAGPGAPPGFARLKEVRSFTRIEIVDSRQ
jgi:hypothetical protein